MNMRLLSLGSLAAVLAIASPGIASEVISLSDSATNPNFAASISAEALDSYEIKAEIKPTFSNNTSSTEVAQSLFSSYNTPKESGVYIGGTLGVFFPNFGSGFPDEVDEASKAAFGGSVYAGYQFNQNWGADLEFALLGGGFDEDKLGQPNADISYSAWALTVNPRYTIPFAQEATNSKLSAFISPGIGISEAKVKVDGDSETSDTSFTWQIKGGLGYQFSDNLEGILQVRYVNVNRIDSDTKNSGVSFISPELGLKYKF
jgi:opacity protein-like surface antigen